VEVPLDAAPLGVGDLDQARPGRAKLGFGPLALGDVAQVARERRLARQGDPRDRQLDRELRSVLVRGRELEPFVEDHRALGLEEAREPAAVRRPERGRHDQLGHLAADRLVRAVAEGCLGRAVPVEHVAAVVDRHDGVERRLEGRAQARLARSHLRLGLPPRDELAHLAAEHAHRLEDALVRPAELAREELHDADDTARAQQRKAERRVQAGPPRRVRARKVPVVGGVDDPARPAGDEHAPRQPLARPERQPLAQRLELGRALACVPRADAAQPAILASDLPHCAQLPAEGAPDRLERRRVDLDRSLRFRKDLRDVVLDALEALRVNDHSHGHH
jgi:hypothetical protein